MIAGLDIGTTGCKIVVYDLRGNELYRSYQSYITKRDDNKAEIDANTVFNSIKFVLKDCASKYQITALGVDSFGEAIVLLDKDDIPLTNIITGGDIRGEKEAEYLSNKLGKDVISSITGLEPNYAYGINKALWFKNHQPELFKKVNRLLMVEDFAIYMLTGKAIIDYSLATRSMMFDLHINDWSQKILDAAGIDRNWLSKPVKLGTIAGSLKDSLKKELGINNDIKIVPAGHDQISVAVGAGIITNDIAVDGAGTVECITPIYDNLNHLDEMVKYHYGIAPYFDKYTTYAYSYCCGSLINWYKDNFLSGINEDKHYEILEKDFVNKPSGLLVLPHFMGAAVPYMDSNSKGMIVGLTLNHTLSNIYQGFLEGIAYEMKINLDTLKKCGIKPKKLVATGGGASSKKWLQIKANICNMPIKILSIKEAGCKGGAMIAGVATNEYSDIKEATKKMVKYIGIIKPQKEVVALYKEQYKKYKKLYHIVKGLEK